MEKQPSEKRFALLIDADNVSAKYIKPITDDLKVYELPEAFSRDDLKKLRESKELIIEDTERYAEEHKNDEKFVEYNAKFEQMQKEREEREKQAEKDAKKKKKKKKDSAPYMDGGNE